MHWLYLLLALAAMFAASKVTGWLVALLIFAALGLMIAWLIGWISSRISSGARTDTQILSPEELRQMRELSNARKAAMNKDEPQV